MSDEVILNLRGLTVDARKSIIKTITECQKMIDDEINQLALIQMTQFDAEETPGYLSDMESM